jgi:hypothetical protein
LGHDAEIVGSLTFEDALLICACLEKPGFRAGGDLWSLSMRARYGLLIKHECLSIAISILQDLQDMRMVWRIASTIPKE